MIEKYKKDEGYLIDKEANIRDLPKNKLQRLIWLLFEYPHSSTMARIIAVISVFFVFISIATFCIETIPEIKEMRTTPSIISSTTPVYISSTTPALISSTTPEFISSSTSSITSTISTSITTALIPNNTNSIIIDEFFIIETICIVWFSIELILRFFGAPKKMLFIKELGNIIDFFSILPYFMQVADISAKFSVLRIIRLVRVFRIFKLARHFKGLQILIHTFIASANELTLLVFFLIIGVILFSSIVYFCELDHPNSDFESIPDGFWYALITMTTVILFCNY